MEDTNEITTSALNSLVKINHLVTERNQRLWRTQAHEKYIKIECENLIKSIEEFRAKLETEKLTCKNFEEYVEHTEKIRESEMQTIELTIKINPQLVQRQIDEENKSKNWVDKLDTTRSKHLELFEQFKRNSENKNPLLKEIHDEIVQKNKLEYDIKLIKQRIMNEKVKQVLKKEIHTKLFYSPVINFSGAVSIYYRNKILLNELKEKKILVKTLQKTSIEQKWFEKGNKHNEYISNKSDISKLNLQLTIDLPGSTYRSILPEIASRSAHQKYDAQEINVSNIFGKHGMKNLEQMEIGERSITKKQIPRYKEQTKRHTSQIFDDDNSLKLFKKPFQSCKTTDPKTCKQTQSHIRNKNNCMKNLHSKDTKNVVEHFSQKHFMAQPSFNMVEDTEMVFHNDQANFNKTMSQSKLKTAKPSMTSYNFIQNSQTPLEEFTEAKQKVTPQVSENLKPLNFSFDNVKFTDSAANCNESNIIKKPEQQIRISPAKNKIYNKLANFNTKHHHEEFSPYFPKGGPRQNIQSDFTSDENNKNALTTIFEPTQDEAEQYLSYEFLTPEDNELNVTHNITFLGEDKSVESTEEESGFLFNLGIPNTQSSSLKPFSFFN